MEESAPDKKNKTVGEKRSAAALPVAYELELHRLVELAAYYRAEQDGFRCSPLEYWLAAEGQVQRLP